MQVRSDTERGNLEEDYESSSSEGDYQSCSSGGDYESCSSGEDYESMRFWEDFEKHSSQRSDIKNQYGLNFNKIREEKIQQKGQDRKGQHQDERGVICDVCLLNYSSMYRGNTLAFYLCYVCEQYLCKSCFKGHESHERISLVCEESERDGQINSFLDEMRNESEREKKFDSENVSMVDRVNVSHRLDQYVCFAHGLCGLDNTSWVVSDQDNYCIKIFNKGSNILQRYVRLGSKPWDVTEIKSKSESTEQDEMSAVDISVTNQGKQETQCLIAVTFPWEYLILIIDVTLNPAGIFKSMSTGKKCWSIEFSEDRLLTLCGDGFKDGGPSFIFMTYIDSDASEIINIGLQFTHMPYLAVFSGRIYLADPLKHKVICLGYNGIEISHKQISYSNPVGISVDPDNNHLYVCCLFLDKLYRLDLDLASSVIFDLESVKLQQPMLMCLHRGKLYVSQGPQSHPSNCVNVIRIL